MALLPILRYPDPRLQTVSAAVERFDAALATLAADLLDTLRAAPGIGITAAHCGLFQRLTVLDLDPRLHPDLGPAPQIFVNPEIVWSSPERASATEGSISMPGASESVERPARVRVAYRGLDGAAREIEAEGLLSVCLQHEIDQMDGLFWLQRLSRLKRDRLIRKWQKLGR